MAKGKHSAALFEVINSSKRPDRIAQSLSTPRWWFKGKQASASAGGATAAPATQLPPPSFSETDPTEPVAPASPSRVRLAPGTGGPSRSAVHVGFDRDQKELTVRLRYTTALVSVFVVGVLVAVAYVAGRHLGGGPRIASAESSHVQDLMRQAPQHGVTDVPVHSHARPIVESAIQDVPRHTTQSGNAAKQPGAATANTAAPSGDADTALPRAVGLNYVIIQSYPPQEQATAQKAMEFLNQNGIACTLESVKDFNPRAGWICLVGKTGFSRIHGPECESYLRRIEDLGAKFPSSKFDRFDPHTYKWKG